jgi:thioredoxin reductase
MPSGMHLKSDGFASNLSAPAPGSTLADYCRAHDLPYHPTDLPVPLETFVDYGLDFQRRFVPDVEQRCVASVEPTKQGYRLTLDDGEELDARQVVVAAGITHFALLPDALTGLPPEQVTHSSAHSDLCRFAGQDVTVVGAGSSAVDLAVGLAEAGARPRVVCRAASVTFSSMSNGGRPRRLGRFLHPPSGLGPGFRSRLCCDAPQLFRFLPQDARSTIVRRHLGPSSPGYLKPRFESDVELLAARSIRRAEVSNRRVHLELVNGDGRATSLETDHVIGASGYRADLGRLRFLDPALRARVKTTNNAPVLDHDFESSAPGLFFVGIAAAMSFGPLMRFMYGDEFCAPRVVNRLVKSAT